MIFEKKLVPDFMLSSFKDVTPHFLKKLGAAAVISDIDNTLAPYEDLDAPDSVITWIHELEAAGIKVTLVSNNNSKRVERFNKKLGCNAHANVKKPSAKYLKLSMKEMESKKENTVFLGDQLLTDSLAAHRAGIRAVIVPPIKDKKSLFFKAKRLIERPYIKKYRRTNNDET